MSHEAVIRSREAVIELLVEGRRIWPLLPYNACRFCGVPREPDFAKNWPTSYRCKQAHDLYGEALTDLYPLSLTTKDWAVGASMRKFKDRYQVRPESRFALGFGAVLSAWLEAQLPRHRLGLPWDFGVVTTVPTSKPAIVSALTRAEQEGWWVPPLQQVAVARENAVRQRDRSGDERVWIKDKWQVDGAAVLGHDVLVLDDICTTTASVHSLAVALRAAGAQSVRAVVLGRNVGSDGAWLLPKLAERHAVGVRWHPAQNKYDLLH